MRVLIFTNLKSQISFSDSTNINLNEPTHPYQGFNWTKLLSKKGYKIDYLNTSNILKKNQSFIRKILNISYYDIVVFYSTNGFGKAFLCKLFNPKIKISFFLLSFSNPDGVYIKKIFRRFACFFDCLISDKIFFGLNELRNSFPIKYLNKNKIEYYPFNTDLLFFKRQLDLKTKISLPNEFILIAGDITRDDDYVYQELSNIKIPLVRVSRDSLVISKVKELYNKERGDKILSQISFADLANLYNKSLINIVASKFDHWQPGGITTIVESLACGGVNLVNANGILQQEFNHLSSFFEIEDPIIYYEYSKKGYLKSNVNNLINKNQKEIKKIKSMAFNFAKIALKIDISKIKLIN